MRGLVSKDGKAGVAGDWRGCRIWVGSVALSLTRIQPLFPPDPPKSPVAMSPSLRV
jgi:hypothetical protein